MDAEQNQQHKISTFYRMVKKMYHNAPPFFRSILTPVAKITWLLRLLRVEQWIISGEERYSGKKLELAYAGDEQNRCFFSKQAFGEKFSERYIGRTWLWKLAGRNGEPCSDSCLVINEVPRFLRSFFSGGQSFYIPSWIDGEVDISPENAALFKHRELSKHVMRKIQENDLSHSISDSPHDLRTFYHSMYQPYISATYGKGAFLEEWDHIQSVFKNCLLLFVKKGEEVIAGILIRLLNNSRSHFWILGIKEGKSSHIEDGAIAALYYFGYNYLKERGYRKVDLGPSRAFLRDGVLEFKKRRGLQINGFSRMGLSVKPAAGSEAIKSFFMNNPFIYLEKDKLLGAIFIEGDHPPSQQEHQRFLINYGINGLSKLCFYSFSASDGTLREIAPEDCINVTEEPGR